MNNRYRYVNQSLGSDTYPFELIEQLTKTKFLVRKIDTVNKTKQRINDWEYIINPNNEILEIKITKHSNYYLSEEPKKHFDFSF